MGAWQQGSLLYGYILLPSQINSNFLMFYLCYNVQNPQCVYVKILERLASKGNINDVSIECFT